jgi:hypothetical protein
MELELGFFEENFPIARAFDSGSFPSTALAFPMTARVGIPKTETSWEGTVTLFVLLFRVCVWKEKRGKRSSRWSLFSLRFLCGYLCVWDSD